MIQVNVKTGQDSKQYIRHLPFYEYTSLLELIWALFENYDSGTKNWLQEAFKFLEAYGVKDVSDIKDYEINHLIRILKSDRATYSLIYDAEKLTYLLLSKVASEEIQVIIDNKIIETINKPIHLTPTSTITFLDINHISLINFNTI